MSDTVPTAEFASLVYGDQAVPFDDPAEAFHEGSRLSPRVAPGRLTTIVELARSSELNETIARSSRTHAHRPGVHLETPDTRPETSLWAAIERRVSRTSVPGPPLQLDVLAALLEASYRSVLRDGAVGRRPVPSGGALYPLEVYVAALDIDRLATGVYHYDPFRHRLARLRPLERCELAAAVVDPAVVEHAGAVVVVSSVFWRTRFKYGLRGYRFALLEAGHLVQNALLAATAYGIDAVPLGGFYDRRIDALAGLDGLDEASLYVLALGGSCP